MDDDTRWRDLYRVGGVAALVMAVFIPTQIAIFIISPPPSTTLGWFQLFRRSPLLGLLDADLLLVADQVLIALMMIALYVALRKVSESWMAIALGLGLISVATYFASGVAFEMLSLSNQYAAATTDAQRAVLLAAGQMTTAVWQGTAFDVSYVLAAFALLIIGLVQWRSTVFGKVTAGAGIVMGAMSLLPPTAGTIGMVLALGSLVPLEIWAVLVGRRLLQLGAGGTATPLES